MTTPAEKANQQFWEELRKAGFSLRPATPYDGVPEPLRVYVFRNNDPTNVKEPLFCVGDRKEVEEVLHPLRLQSLFRHTFAFTDNRAREYIGVLGRRKGAKFRELLRQAGVRVQVSQFRPCDFLLIDNPVTP